VKGFSRYLGHLIQGDFSTVESFAINANLRDLFNVSRSERFNPPLPRLLIIAVRFTWSGPFTEIYK